MENDYFKLNKEPQVDFEGLITQIEPLSKSAKVHFVWKLIQTFTPGMCRTLIRYGHQRLNVLNNDILNRQCTNK